MIWQDAVITVGQIAFVVALVPSIFSNQKPSRWTCFITATFLFAFGGAYASLGLAWSTVTVIVAAIAWSVLIFQKRIERRPFAWYDVFNDVVYRRDADATRAAAGGNDIVALYREEEEDEAL